MVIYGDFPAGMEGHCLMCRELNTANADCLLAQCFQGLRSVHVLLYRWHGICIINISKPLNSIVSISEARSHTESMPQTRSSYSGVLRSLSRSSNGVTKVMQMKVAMTGVIPVDLPPIQVIILRQCIRLTCPLLASHEVPLALG